MKTKILKVVFDRETQINDLNTLYNSYSGTQWGSNKKLSYRRNKGHKRSVIASPLNTTIFGESSTNLNSVQIDLIFSDEVTNKNHLDYDYNMLSSEHNCKDGNIQSKAIQMMFDKNIVLGMLTNDFNIYIYSSEKKVSEFLPKVLFQNNYCKASRIGFARDVVKTKLLDVVESSIIRAEKEIKDKQKQISNINTVIEKYHNILNS